MTDEQVTFWTNEENLEELDASVKAEELTEPSEMVAYVSETHVHFFDLPVSVHNFPDLHTAVNHIQWNPIRTQAEMN